MKKLLMCCSLLVISLAGCGGSGDMVDGETIYTEEMRADLEAQEAQDREDYLREHGDEFLTEAAGEETGNQPGGDAAGKSPAD